MFYSPFALAEELSTEQGMDFGKETSMVCEDDERMMNYEFYSEFQT